MKSVLFVAAEGLPYIKNGGLAEDVYKRQGQGPLDHQS